MLFKKVLLTLFLPLIISLAYGQNKEKTEEKALIVANPVAAKSHNLQLQTYLDSEAALKILENLILTSNKQIIFFVSKFQSVPLTRALVKRKNDLKILFLAGGANKQRANINYTGLTPLANAGIDVKINKKFKDMQHQIIVIDDKVILSNMNFEDKNDKKSTDKFLVLNDANEIAQTFVELFSQMSKPKKSDDSKKPEESEEFIKLKPNY